MIRKYVVALDDTLKGWQEDEDELERKYDAEPLDCGNCEIVQESINAGIRTALRLVDDVLEKIKAEIEQLRLHKAQFLTSDIKVCIDSQEVLNVIDKHRIDKYKAER